MGSTVLVVFWNRQYDNSTKWDLISPRLLLFGWGSWVPWECGVGFLRWLRPWDSASVRLPSLHGDH